MAATVEGRRLTQAFRRDQLSIRARMLKRVLGLWPLLDWRRLDATSPEWLRLNVNTVLEHRRESARAAARYYEQLRNVEAPQAEPFRARWLDANTVDPTLIETALLVTGPISLKKRTARIATLADAGELFDRRLAEAADTALTEVSGAATRHTLNGGREVLREEAAADPVALAFARVSDGDPCYFCALMISRGFVYRTKDTAGRNANSATSNRKGPRALFVGEGLYKFHDNCACTLEPMFDLDVPKPDAAVKFASIYKDATKGKSGAKAIAAFRAAYDAQR